ncbi:protein MET1, chloroplastic isoform X3 [Cryptomeria japonica]|uniref:protein MET1, chloroplastic isoform X3 n=1 Tax=Cryptomeria japonica TaxID=3369 RepID=UPI0027DA1164|nr:protein MET1, chloroplastic isoform X3 [Cryptomeria japonica]
MLVARSSFFSQSLCLRKDVHGFDSPPPILCTSARPNSKPCTVLAWAKNERLHCVRHIVLQAATSETGTLGSEAESEAAVEAEAKAEAVVEGEAEEYEVEIDKPYGLRFFKGSDGGTYIDAIAPGCSADKTNMFTVGDKVISTSTVFGTEIWPAAEYGRTMYTIRQRVGPLYMKMQKRYGKLVDSAVNEKDIIRAERNSGVISDKVREIQMQNYMRKMELKNKRESELTEGLKYYREGKYESALEKFESVLGSKPEPKELAVTSYNVACCYSKLNQLEAGLSALEDAMEAGYEDYKNWNKNEITQGSPPSSQARPTLPLVGSKT